jgi:hypothetical protein
VAFAGRASREKPTQWKPGWIWNKNERGFPGEQRLARNQGPTGFLYRVHFQRVHESEPCCKRGFGLGYIRAKPSDSGQDICHYHCARSRICMSTGNKSAPFAMMCIYRNSFLVGRMVNHFYLNVVITSETTRASRLLSLCAHFP